MKAMAMKYKVANTLQPFRRLCVADKSGHGGFTFYLHTVTDENHNVIGKLADRHNCNVVRFTEKFNLAVRKKFKLESLD